MEAATTKNGRICHVRLGSIQLDQEFSCLIPKPAKDEQHELLTSLFQQGGGNEPLIVWKWHDRRILLVGYREYPLLRQQRKTYPVIEKEFPNREKAKMFVIRYHIARRVLSPLGLSYLRGLYYEADKSPAGGDRKSAQFQVRKMRKTAETIAEIFGISRSTLRRDALLAKAVDALADNGGQEVIPAILSRETRLTHERIVNLAKQPAREQKRKLTALLINGRLPGTPRSEKATLTLPKNPAGIVEALERRLSEGEFREVCGLMTAVLERKRDGESCLVDQLN